MRPWSSAASTLMSMYSVVPTVQRLGSFEYSVPDRTLKNLVVCVRGIHAGNVRYATVDSDQATQVPVVSSDRLPLAATSLRQVVAAFVSSTRAILSRFGLLSKWVVEFEQAIESPYPTVVIIIFIVGFTLVDIPDDTWHAAGPAAI